MSESWLKCSACRKDIGFSTVHWVCSVSTCNRSRTRLVFCSVSCWDSHVATLRHRDAWAVEARSPTRERWQAEISQEERTAGPSASTVSSTSTASAARLPAAPVHPSSSPVTPAVTPVAASSAGDPVRRRVVADASGAASPGASVPEGPVLTPDVEREVLIVVSKMKKYIRDRSGMNCSDAVAEAISDHVRALCDDAIRTAARDSRKTVLDRDVSKPRS
jgi:hypothetical protein